MMRFKHMCCSMKEDTDFSYLWLPSEYCSEISVRFVCEEKPSERIILAMMKETENLAREEYSEFLVSVVKCDIIYSNPECELVFILCKIPCELLKTLKSTTVRRLTVVFLKAKNISYRFAGQMPDDSALYCKEAIIDVTLS